MSLVTEAHMPTLGEQLTAYFGRPEIAEQLKQLALAELRQRI